MNAIIDARGKLCPEPVIMTKNAVKNSNGTDLIEVLVDNMLVVQNIAKYVEKNNFQMSYQETSEGSFRIEISLSSNSNSESNVQLEAEAEVSNIKKGTVIVIHSNILGQGDEKLGTVLMKNYIYALTKSDLYPETILFYNGGVFLTTEGTDSLQDLIDLATAGVEILSCGACLNHYQLTDALQVGGVTNMYEIVEKMMSASTVITP